MSRIEFQKRHATGSILNLGCGDDPAEFGTRAVHLDVDHWDLPNFVCGDVHDLPFAALSFDTAVLGDVLEHCEDPERAVREAARVARRLVITVPEEKALPSVGQHLALGLKQRADHYREVHGWWDAKMGDEEIVIAHKKTDPRFRGASKTEAECPHDGHVNRFDDAWIERLIAASGKKAVVRERALEHGGEKSWDNWLLVLE